MFPERSLVLGQKIPSLLACLVLLFIVLLVGSCQAYPFTSKKRVDGTSELSTYSQKLTIQANECVALGSCHCSPLGKCRPCSWLDMNRKLPECLASGFKQRSYCSDSKGEKHVGCRYVPDARETRHFWLFEGSALSIGLLAYGVAMARVRKIELKTARRIQEQINA